MNANRTYKDSVFTSLFNDSELLRELYGALGGVKLPQDIPIFINTLEYALCFITALTHTLTKRH